MFVGLLCLALARSRTEIDFDFLVLVGCTTQILSFVPTIGLQRAGVVFECEIQSPQTDSCAVISPSRLIPPSSTLHPSLVILSPPGRIYF